MERRRSIRFRLKCDVTCTWVDEFGDVKATRGFSRDISTGGLFIHSNERPSAGTMANLEIKVPGRSPWGQQLHLHGTGRLVRIVEDGTQSGFAVTSATGWTMSRTAREVAVRAS